MSTSTQNKSDNFKGIYLLILLILFAFGSSSQQVEKHQWKNRLVLVLTDDVKNSNIDKQLVEFRENLSGMKERKLLVYQITPDKYRLGLEEGKWKKSETVYRKYKSEDAQTEILLLGLDGGVKLRVSEFLSCKKLFAAIDVMPMRRQEMNRKKNAASSN